MSRLEGVLLFKGWRSRRKSIPYSSAPVAHQPYLLALATFSFCEALRTPVSQPHQTLFDTLAPSLFLSLAADQLRSMASENMMAASAPSTISKHSAHPRNVSSCREPTKPISSHLTYSATLKADIELEWHRYLSQTLSRSLDSCSCALIVPTAKSQITSSPAFPTLSVDWHMLITPYL